MQIKTVGVVGAGQMGNGIALVAAMSGLPVIMSDVTEDLVQRGLKTITKILAKNVDKGKMSPEDKEAVLGRIQTTVNLQDMAAADVVIEAATENEPLKFQIFRELDAMCPPETILASNTSSIPIGRIAAQTKRPDKVIGMHFMNPVPVMELVELIRALTTSDETFALTRDLCRQVRQDPGGSQRLSRFPHQSHPHAHDQRGGLLPLSGGGHPGDHRHGDAARRQPSPGPPGAGGPHRPGYLPGHHGDPVSRLRRFQIPALSALAQICGGRLAGAQNQTRLLYL